MRRLTPLLPLLLLPLLSACGGGGGGSAGGGDGGGGGGGGGIGQTLTLTLPSNGLAPADLAVIVAEGDALSEAVGAAYLAARGVPAANLVRVRVNTASDVITATDFALLKTDIDAKLPAGAQATLLTWAAPSRVVGSCGMGITSAMAFGYDPRYCNADPSTNACASTAASPLYDSEARRPQAEAQTRPSMLLGARTLVAAQALINRGLASDASKPAGEGWLVRTSDANRAVRWNDFAGLPAAWSGALTLNYVDNSAGPASADALSGKSGVLFYLTGLASVANLSTLQFRPGALADTLTSSGGVLPNGAGQMPITAWLDAGATASYGTVEEPCNLQQKFSRASVLIDHYWRGATAIEAYWKAVQWPGQGLFVGEPLAQPFRDSPSFAIVGGEYRLQTRSLRPGSRYSLEYRIGTGSWTSLAEFTGARGQILDARAPLPPAAATQIRWVGPCPDNVGSRCPLAGSP